MGAGLFGIAVKKLEGFVAAVGLEEKYDAVRQLIAVGKERGYLLYDEVNDSLPAEVHSSEEIDDLLTTFERNGIEIYEDQASAKAARAVEVSAEAGEHEVVVKDDAHSDEGSSDLDLTPGSLEKTNDPVRMYLREMGTVPLLTREGEVTIAKRIERGQLVVMKSITRSPIVIKELIAVGDDLRKGVRSIKEIVQFDDEELTEEKIANKTKQTLRYIDKIAKLYEAALKDIDEASEVGLTELKRTLTFIHRGEAEAEQAKKELIEANLRLVVSIAKKYTNRGLQFLDLIQEGNIGLMKAVDKFEWRRGYKFSTYATWWIRQAITRAIADQARTIRIPVHMIETINKLVRTSRQLVQELGREPTSEEIAKRMDIPVSKVRKILKIAQEPLSLETPIGEEEDSHLGDFIEGKAVVSPSDAVINLNLKEQTSSVLKTLTPREEKVIKMRFGLDDGSEHTLEEVGQSFAVTRERIRQIEAKALRKLRHPSRSRKLRAFLDGVRD